VVAKAEANDRGTNRRFVATDRPGAALLPGLKLEGVYPFIPLLNIVLLARDLLDGTAQPLAALLVVAITFLYGLSALVLAAKIFGRSAVAGT